MPKLQKAALRSLHPTQLTVGMIVVRDKKQHLGEMTAAQQQQFLQAHPMLALVVKYGKLYLIE